MTKESFGNAFSDACRKAGENKSAHGLRKIGATRSEQRRDCGAAQCDLRMDWQQDGFALHAERRPQKIGARRDHETRERNCNIYSLT
jgi:hypothetical protein